MILKAGLTLSLLPGSLQALNTAPCDQGPWLSLQPGFLLPFSAHILIQWHWPVCYSLNILASSCSGPFLLFFFWPQNVLPSHTHMASQGRALLWPSYLNLNSPVYSLTTDFSASHYSLYVICASSPKRIKDLWDEGPSSSVCYIPGV